MIENMILELIDNEDKKIPLTDNDIAKKVNTTRAYITRFRKEKKLPTSNQRREEILHNDIIRIISDNNLISDNMLCKRLSEIGYDISRYSVTQIRKDIVGNATKDIGDKIVVEKATKQVVDNARKDLVDNAVDEQIENIDKNVSSNKLNNKKKLHPIGTDNPT